MYEDDEMVTVIVELEDAPVMDYYGVSTYAAENNDASAGEAVSEFLASDEVKEASEEILSSQNAVIEQVTETVSEGKNTSTVMSSKAKTASISAEVTDQWSIVTNAFAIKMPYGKLDEVKELDGVKRAYVQHVYSLPEETAV